jgi:hypothetical protein
VLTSVLAATVAFKAASAAMPLTRHARAPLSGNIAGNVVCRLVHLCTLSAAGSLLG